MKLTALILCLYCGFLSAQAELEKVRDMFPEPNDHIVVDIWKGNISQAHPVEMYLSIVDQDVMGYYRIISSGDEYVLEGEYDGSNFILSEYNKAGQEIGRLISVEKNNENLTLNWYNLSNNNTLPFTFVKSLFSDYPPSYFKAQITTYSNFTSTPLESILVEEINLDEIMLHYAKATDEISFKLLPESIEPLQCQFELEGNLVEISELQDKIRLRRNDKFSYFSKEQTLTLEKLSYANHHLLMDIDFPQANNATFDAWINAEISNRKKSIRKEIESQTKNSDLPDSETHFSYEWSSWTEIDHLSEQLISGRIVFIKSWSEELETFTFNYDLVDNLPIDLLSTFKKDFNIREYINRFVQNELNKVNANPENLQAEQFSEISISQNSLILSTPFNWYYGYKKVKIPFVELEGLVKRNSILKTVIRT